MPDIVHVTYARTGQSSKTNSLGMREMFLMMRIQRGIMRLAWKNLTEIDRLVYRLYGLTPEEISIIERKSKINQLQEK